MSFTGMNSRGHDVRSRNKKTDGKTIVVPRRADKTPLGPELPSGIAWHEQTKSWYENWRRSDLAPLFEPSDWQFLVDTALIHTAVWSGTLSVREKITYMAELRRRESSLGATLLDRNQMKLEFSDEGFPFRANLPSLNLAGVDYEKLLTEDE